MLPLSVQKLRAGIWTLSCIVAKMLYLFILETLHNFAFYSCVTPYRIQKTDNAVYYAANFRFQKVASIICYILPHYWHIVITYNWYRNIWRSGYTYPGDPTPYFALFYRITSSASACAMMHAVVFHQKLYLKYINTLFRILNPCKNRKATTIRVKILKFFIFTLLFLYTFFAVNLFFIGRHYHLDMNSIFVQIRLFFVVEELWNYVVVVENENSVGNYVFATIYILTSVIKNVQECYCFLFHVISIYGLVKASKQFRDSCKINSNVKQILTHYKRIYRLVRRHEMFYGWALLWYLFSGIFCCVFFVVLVDYSSSFGTIGVTIIKIWLALCYAIVIGFGIAFLTMMGNIGIFLDLKTPLGLNRQAIILHVKNRQLCRIQASVMPITYSMLSKFALFSMTILIVTMSIDCTKCI